MELEQENSDGAKSLGKGVEESYDFDITKSDKLFDFLLERGQIKLPANHVMLPPDQLKNKKFYKFHNATSHSTNECRIFRQHIQRAIQQGKLKFNTPRSHKDRFIVHLA